MLIFDNTMKETNMKMNDSFECELFSVMCSVVVTDQQPEPDVILAERGS